MSASVGASSPHFLCVFVLALFLLGVLSELSRAIQSQDRVSIINNLKGRTLRRGYRGRYQIPTSQHHGVDLYRGVCFSKPAHSEILLPHQEGRQTAQLDLRGFACYYNAGHKVRNAPVLASSEGGVEGSSTRATDLDLDFRSFKMKFSIAHV